MSSHPDNAPRDVLFIPSGSIGDALMMISLCAEMSLFDPRLRYTIIARRNAGLISDLAREYPSIRVLSIHKNLGGILSLLWHSLERPYLVLMPAVFGKGTFLTTRNLFLLLRLRPGTRTVGLLRDTEPNPYDIALPYDHALLHFDNMRRMPRAAGAQVREEGAPVERLVVHHSDTRPQAQPEGAYIVIHPFGSSSWKSFPPRRIRSLLTQLANAHPELSFVITGGPENLQQAQEIAAGMPRTTVAAGMPILDAAAIIAGARLYLGVDTGTTHLAALMQQQVIALEHNASPEWLPTYDPHAIVLTTTEACACNGRKNGECKVIEDGVPYHRCLYDIPDSAILEAVVGVLAAPKA